MYLKMYFGILFLCGYLFLWFIFPILSEIILTYIILKTNNNFLKRQNGWRKKQSFSEIRCSLSLNRP